MREANHQQEPTEANPAIGDETITGIQWEAHRVATAFGVEKWGEDVWFMHTDASLFSGTKGELEVVWRINPEGYACHFRVGNGGIHDCTVTWREMAWSSKTYGSHPEYNALMARGLYCLGIDAPSVVAKLNSPLSAHEQIELRLSMPREFWPPSWLEAASKSSHSTNTSDFDVHPPTALGDGA